MPHTRIGSFLMSLFHNDVDYILIHTLMCKERNNFPFFFLTVYTYNKRYNKESERESAHISCVVSVDEELLKWLAEKYFILARIIESIFLYYYFYIVKQKQQFSEINLINKFKQCTTVRMNIPSLFYRDQIHLKRFDFPSLFFFMLVLCGGENGFVSVGKTPKWSFGVQNLSVVNMKPLHYSVFNLII